MSSGSTVQCFFQHCLLAEEEQLQGQFLQSLKKSLKGLEFSALLVAGTLGSCVPRCVDASACTCMCSQGNFPFRKQSCRLQQSMSFQTISYCRFHEEDEVVIAVVRSPLIPVLPLSDRACVFDVRAKEGIVLQCYDRGSTTNTNPDPYPNSNQN